MFPMHVLEMSGQEYAQRAADYLGLRISKNLLGTLIEEDNALLGINRDYRVLGDFHNTFKPGICGARCFLCSPPFGLVEHERNALVFVRFGGRRSIGSGRES